MGFPPFWLRLLAHLPLRHLHAAGAALGWLVYAVSPSYRRRLRANARLAGVGASERRASVGHAGRMSLEMPRLWLRPREAPIADPVRWENAELIERLVGSADAQGRRRGLLLLTPHMGSFEIAAQAYAERFGPRQPITVLYRPARQRLLRELEETARARPHLATAPATLAGVRLLLRALKRGETVGLLPDQVPPSGMGVWAPFFGQPAYTMTLATRLARQTGAAVIGIWAERLPRGAGYVVRPLELPVPLAEAAAQPADEAAAALADASAINGSMEAMIALAPSQYLWGYHRYKQPRQEAPSASAVDAAATPGSAR